jgi:hypothetical protein
VKRRTMRSPTECGVSECVIVKRRTMRSPTECGVSECVIVKRGNGAA